MTATLSTGYVVTEISATYDEIVTAINAGKNVVIWAKIPVGYTISVHHNMTDGDLLIFTGEYADTLDKYTILLAEDGAEWTRTFGISDVSLNNKLQDYAKSPVTVPVTDNGDGTYSIEVSNTAMHQATQEGYIFVIDAFDVKMYLVASNETTAWFSAVKDGTIYSFVAQNGVGTLETTAAQPKITGTAGQFVVIGDDGSPTVATLTNVSEVGA